jgi:hypothetical protein
MADRGRKIAHIVKLVAFSLTPAIVLVVLAETLSGVAIYRRARTLPDSASGGTVYTMRIGRWPWSRATVTPLNSLGFPDREFPQTPPADGCRRVVFAGDSYVFGDGVDRDSNFVEIIRRRTANRRGGCVHVFNLGKRGTTIDRQAGYILTTLDRIKPDLVILGQYQNDLVDLTNAGAILDPNRNVRSRGDSIRVRFAILNSSLIKMLTYRTFAFMIQQGMERDELRHWSVMADSSRQADAARFQHTYSTIYAELAATLARRGVGFGVVIIPSKFDILARRSPEEAYFISLAETHRVPYLRLFPVFDARREPYAFLMYDGHLNEHGNRILADAVYTWLFESEPAPFAALRQPRPTTPPRGPGRL